MLPIGGEVERPKSELNHSRVHRTSSPLNITVAQRATCMPLLMFEMRALIFGGVMRPNPPMALHATKNLVRQPQRFLH